MINQGKHAKVNLYKDQVKVYKTYNESEYAENEFFALSFLAKTNIMNLNPTIVDSKTISIDWLKDTEPVEINKNIVSNELAFFLATYLKNLHTKSFEYYSYFLTHEDIFLDNVLKSKNSENIYLIDWGLSNKRTTVYPDISSIAIGILNDHPYIYCLFIEEYFGSLSNCNKKELKATIKCLYDKYYSIREVNNIETNSLKERLEKSHELIKLI